jgi:hypothetical protein
MTPTPKENHEPPLTDSEISRLRAVLNQDEFVRKFWASIRSWVLAIAAVIGALTIGAEAIGKALLWIRGK